MLRLNQMDDQFTGMEKSFFYEYEDLYEDIDENKSDKDNRREKSPQRVKNPFFI